MSNYNQDPFINFDGIQKIQQELGRLFEGDWVKPSARYNESGNWSPAIDTIETENDWHYLIDLPGVALADVNVSVHRGQIKIKGSKQAAQLGTVVSNERPNGVFERTINLSDDADEASLNASMKHGVLSLTVSKSHQSGARVISVKEVD